MTRDLRNVTVRQVTAVVLVIAVLVAADVLSTRTLKFLLLPPFGALAYLMFVNPAAIEINVRRVILAPTLTAVLAWTLAGTLGYTPLSVALGTLGTLLLLWLLQSHMVVPPIALELLTLLLHSDIQGRVGYLLSVLAFTVVVYVLYRLWSLLPLDVPLFPSR